MKTRVISSAMAALLLLAALAVGGCGGSSRKTCDELWAEHRSCPPLQWHEENEGPSVYNHFHSTQ